MPPVKERRNSLLVKSIKPKGRMLNDNGCGIDHLGTSVYARALANQINDVNTPVTFGIFARWGSGKSFLIKHIQSILRKRERKNQLKQNDILIERSTCKVFVESISILFVLAALGALSGLVIQPEKFCIFKTDQIKYTRIGIGLLLGLLVALLVSCFYQRLKLNKHGIFKIMVVMYAKFTKLPILEPEHNIAGVKREKYINLKLDEKSENTNLQKSEKQDSSATKNSIRYIFVDFNAWKYAGSDNLWAGIVLALAEAVEREFSSVTTRLFRGITLQKVSKSEFNPQPIYVKINDTECTVINLAEQYGDVISCKKCDKNVDSKNNKNWWSVRYSSNAQADLAVQMLERASIKAQREHPFKEAHTEKQNIEKTQFLAHLKKYARKHCGIADLYWVLIFLVLVLSLPAAVFLITKASSDNPNGQATDISLIFSQVIAWLPAGFTFIYVSVTNSYAMVKSQTNRLVTLLRGIEGNLANELGFMHKVKEEVQYITDLIHTVEFVYNVKYKVIIAIDDLDRIPLPKIRLVLEAVNILLSDRSSPFVCLIAVDSRIAVESLEKPDRDNEQVPRISGHEYLKKIINIPFCLPEITELDKKNYVAGLIDESDNTTKHNKKYQYLDEPFKQDTHQAEDKTQNLIEGLPFDDDVYVKYEEPSLEKTAIETRKISTKGPETHKQQFRRGKTKLERGKTNKTQENFMYIKNKALYDRMINTQKRMVNIQDDVLYDSTVANNDTSNFEDYGSVNSEALPLPGKPFTGKKLDRADIYVEFQPKSLPPPPIPQKRITKLQSFTLNDKIQKRPKNQRPETLPSNDPKTRLDKFLLDCRTNFLDDFLIQHLEGNPRNIKRIFNVISLTALVVGCHQENEEQENKLNRIAKKSNPDLQQANRNTRSPYKKPKHNMNDDLARSIVTWVMLTDQWPYRSSYILQVIEDSDQRIDDKESFIADDAKLCEIYNRFVIPEISIKEKEILNLDGDPDIFRRFLHKQHLSKGRVKTLLKYTINLDQGLRNKVAMNRAILYIQAQKKQLQQNTSSGNKEKAPLPIPLRDMTSDLRHRHIGTSSVPRLPSNTQTGLTEVDSKRNLKRGEDYVNGDPVVKNKNRLTTQPSMKPAEVLGFSK